MKGQCTREHWTGDTRAEQGERAQATSGNRSSTYGEKRYIHSDAQSTNTTSNTSLLRLLLSERRKSKSSNSIKPQNQTPTNSMKSIPILSNLAK